MRRRLSRRSRQSSQKVRTIWLIREVGVAAAAWAFRQIVGLKPVPRLHCYRGMAGGARGITMVAYAILIYFLSSEERHENPAQRRTRVGDAAPGGHRRVRDEYCD